MKYIGLFDNQEDIVTKEKLDTKQDTITGAATSITDSDLTASRALVSDANGKVAASAVTSTELGYLDGVTSNIQTQLNSKLSAAPVTSVNNKTGAVSLTASDVSAIPSTLTGTAGQVLTKTAGGQEWADAPVDDETVLLKSVDATLPTSANWQSVAYGNGKFVANAYGSSVFAYSTDGINWTQGTMPTSANWQSVAYGNGKFVAVAYSSSVFAYSTDGINWTQGTMPTSTYWRSVAYGNGKFVANAYGSSVFAYSTDGINWTQGTMPTSANWQSVAYGNGKFVAVAYSSSVFAYSTDGINWTQGTMPTSANWQSVAYGNGKFVAVAYSSSVFAYSTDGINWTQGTMPTSANWQSVAYGNGKFVAVVYYGSDIFAYSTDGINWTQGTMPTSAIWSSVAYGNGKFVAVAAGSVIFAYSTDGINWKSTVEALQYPDGTDIHERVKTALQIEEPDVPTPSDTAPLALAETAAAGTSTEYSRGDHVHPSEMFLCIVTGNSSDGYTCDKTIEEIKAAYTSNKLCFAYFTDTDIYGNTHICRLTHYRILQATDMAIFANVGLYYNKHANYSESVQIQITRFAVNVFYNDIANVPLARKVTLTAAGWDSSTKQQTITVTGVAGDYTMQVSVMPVNAAINNPYIAAGVQCVAEEYDKLTFGCETVPTDDIDVYVVMQNVEFVS